MHADYCYIHALYKPNVLWRIYLNIFGMSIFFENSRPITGSTNTTSRHSHVDDFVVKATWDSNRRITKSTLQTRVLHFLNFQIYRLTQILLIHVHKGPRTYRESSLYKEHTTASLSRNPRCVLFEGPVSWTDHRHSRLCRTFSTNPTN